MTERASAEATVTLGAAIDDAMLAAARIAGIMAAKNMADLIPLRQATALDSTTVEFDRTASGIHVVANVTAVEAADARMAAMTAATVAALALCDMAQGTGIEKVRLLDAARAPQQKPSREIVTDRQTRAKPRTIMGEVTAPRPSADSRRDAFRNFMVGRRLRPTSWAKDAGVPLGEIMGFLTGRSRGFSPEIAEKLARAAKAKVDDMFRA